MIYIISHVRTRYLSFFSISLISCLRVCVRVCVCVCVCVCVVYPFTFEYAVHFKRRGYFWIFLPLASIQVTPARMRAEREAFVRGFIWKWISRGEDRI